MVNPQKKFFLPVKSTLLSLLMKKKLNLDIAKRYRAKSMKMKLILSVKQSYERLLVISVVDKIKAKME